MKEIEKATADTAGISKMDLKRQNRMYILRSLRNNGSSCRADLAEGTGLTRAAVTVIVNEMISEGVLCETGISPPDEESKGTRGRKKILMDINETYRLVLGLMLDAGQIVLGLCTLKGRTVEKQTCPMPEDGDAIFAEIGRMYGEIFYKNDLRPDMLVGMGVCISSEYRGAVGVTVDDRGTVDYSAAEKELGKFCKLPMTFGTVAEGAAIAEMDLRPAGEIPPVNAVILRTDRDLDTAVIVCRDLYRGTFGRPAAIMQMTGSPAHKVQYDYVLDRVRQGGYEKGFNFVWTMHRRNITDPMKLFCDRTFRPADAYHIALLKEVEDTYFWMYDLLLHAYAPDKVVLIGESGVERAVENALRRVNRMYPQAEDGIVCRSILRETDLFKGAVALAVREFFIDRGGL